MAIFLLTLRVGHPPVYVRTSSSLAQNKESFNPLTAIKAGGIRFIFSVGTVPVQRTRNVANR